MGRETKGNDDQRSIHCLRMKTINFIGNVDDIPKVWMYLCDGFVGNILLNLQKVALGLFDLKEELTKCFS